MRDFIKMSPRFWVGTTGRALRKCGPDAQLLALYLLSSPHCNYIGLYRLPMSYIVDDTGMSVERIAVALSSLEGLDFARYDASSETCYVVKSASWQVGELKQRDSRVPYVQREFDAIPDESPFKEDFFKRYQQSLKLTKSGEGSLKACYPEHFRNGDDGLKAQLSVGRLRDI